MPLRKEQEVVIYGTTYVLKQLPGTKGASMMARLLRLFFGGAEGIGELLQRPEVKAIIEQFFTTSLTISDVALQEVSPEIRRRAEAIKGKSFESSEQLYEALLEHLQDEAAARESAVNIYKTAALDTTPEFASLLAISGHLLSLLKSVIDKIDIDEFADLISSFINLSVIRYRPEKAEEFRQWINKNGDYEFDEHFGGNYNAMLELFVYLIVFNYAESMIMLKKNQILSHLSPYLEMIKPTTEEPSKHD